jgi:hypothetical protein
MPLILISNEKARTYKTLRTMASGRFITIPGFRQGKNAFLNMHKVKAGIHTFNITLPRVHYPRDSARSNLPE